MGRKKLWPERLTLPVTAEMVAAMDAALKEGETRLDLIREAIDRELKRRSRRSSLWLSSREERGAGCGKIVTFPKN